MDSDTGLEESMWQLRVEGPAYPERPGEPDCSYYVRTGSCGFGDRCRFNHPRNRILVGGEARTTDFPERTGQPVCQYFLKTGTCKYGASCKYDHPRHGSGSVRPVSLNYYGYPLRPGEKECTYYVRTGQCKFGSTCKFHHPELGSAQVPSPAPAFYPSAQAPTMASWQVARPAMLPTPYMQPTYGSMVISPGVVQVPSWSPYPPTASPALSPGGQHNVQAATLYGSSNQLSPSAPAYPGPYTALASSGPPSSSQKDHMFPERPGQPECQYYMRTGDCKFGPTCKYHHPPDRIPRIDCGLNPLGLPLRPGVQPCSFYAQHGVCKFGPTCKFDHPMVLSYTTSASSLTDMPVAPYPLGFSVATLTPSASSSELRPEFISNKYSFSRQIPPSESTHGGSMFPRSSFAPHTLAHFSGQTSTTSGGSSMGQRGDYSSSS
ncbi:zinc finger CCCH domain-containing protein 5-like [Iris pallida]|uniref:Zinc finger CCCH domain-containing protein 5-like n=1 Tax=Iris pallida TaxID=29817 RepID=A0AAX6I4L9_IRIPA|nr:zinc finger CCCH domain-containing protein 5-like [Iris pallida]KAJ6848236.1 zinc finger CCCH domain-containing protein 5-like [Iris pallida]